MRNRPLVAKSRGWEDRETHSPASREREPEPRSSPGPRTAPGLRTLVSLSVVQTHRHRPHRQDSCPFPSLAWCRQQAVWICSHYPHPELRGCPVNTLVCR